MDDSIKVYTDGGSRGNPGPSACAFVAYVKGKSIKKDSIFLNIGTNNQAEYKAVLLAMEWIIKDLKNVGSREIRFFLDSELVVKQLNGLYRIKDGNLQSLAAKIKEIEKSINNKVTFTSIRRELNKTADGLVNKVLDKQLLHETNP